MHTVELKLVTLIIERVLKDKVLRDLKKLGAKGWTLTNVSGSGSRGVRASEWEGENLRVEAVVSPVVAEKIVEHVAAKYFEHYAVIVYMENVQVVRGDKYV